MHHQYKFAETNMHYFDPRDYLNKIFIYLGTGESPQIMFCQVVDYSGTVYIRADDRDEVVTDCSFRTRASSDYSTVKEGLGSNGYTTKRMLDRLWEPMDETKELLYGNKR